MFGDFGELQFTISKTIGTSINKKTNETKDIWIYRISATYDDVYYSEYSSDPEIAFKELLKKIKEHKKES